jgi:hypothetical protein
MTISDVATRLAFALLAIIGGLMFFRVISDGLVVLFFPGLLLLLLLRSILIKPKPSHPQPPLP